MYLGVLKTEKKIKKYIKKIIKMCKKNWLKFKATLNYERLIMLSN